jgi:energy-coupling factor transporter transmembrane protein EcfT
MKSHNAAMPGSGRAARETVRATLPGPARPPGSRQLGRLGLYLVLQGSIFLLPPAWLPLPALAIAALGRKAGLRWWSWLASVRGLLPLVLMPALFGIPAWPAAPAATAGPTQAALAFLDAWSPALGRSIAFLLVLASAAWMAAGSSPVELRDALGILLRPFGRPGRRAALAASLVLAFIPWTRSEIAMAGAAARLRGADPRRRPLRWLGALGLPVSLRVLEKARRSAEALELRGGGASSGPEPRKGTREATERRAGSSAPQHVLE